MKAVILISVLSFFYTYFNFSENIIIENVILNYYSKEATYKLSNDTLRYSNNNDTILQSADIVFLCDTNMYFKLDCRKKGETNGIKFSGIAHLISNRTGSSETSVDEDGFGIFVDAFEYKEHDCEMLLFVEADNFERLTFFGKCKKDKLDFRSVGTLRIKKLNIPIPSKKLPGK